MISSSKPKAPANATESRADWALAKKCAGKLGYIPSSFTVAVRALVADQFQNRGLIRPVTKYQVSRLLKGKTFKAMLYYATSDMRREYLSDKPYWAVGTMMDIFEPLDIATILASFVFYRKCQKLVPPEISGIVAERLNVEAQIASHFGAAVPEIGVGLSLIANIFHYFALCAMALEFKDTFPKYLRTLVKAKDIDNAKEEEQTFGCSSTQVVIFLLSSFGFGPEIANAFSMNTDKSRALENVKDEMELRMRYARLWVDALKSGKTQPESRLGVRFFPMASLHEVLKQRVAAVLDGSPNWMARSKADISKERTPQLFGATNSDSEIPQELREVFSMDDISKMVEEDFDDLIDQIDAENGEQVKPKSFVLNKKDLEDLEQIVE